MPGNARTIIQVLKTNPAGAVAAWAAFKLCFSLGSPGVEHQELSTPANCVFCDIVAGRSPAKVRYLDEDIIVFVNRLTWVPVMLLVVPKKHYSQLELWNSGILNRLGKVAAEIGCMYSVGGFRILSNFGPDGMQSQSHGHLHVVGGTPLIEYA